MLQNDRDNLELDKLLIETRKLLAETRKLTAEETKLKHEAFWYPYAVGARVATALVAVAGFGIKI
ncbi:hypothetical protein SAMN03159382_03927 [Pseudomonas sp. NFACC23-1]|uniref:hypothetical protein n=1 Tax=unclassified Pseudomonas TaxID=196821 RepID=UPI000891B8C5|nr:MULTISPECIES: hypothetical protein [unclassified Pseudomonas]SDB51795.1 hypothetical protein SAMN03159386_03946 [Pseudomonas sp. NFACC17-2]SEJ71233.1 hypothetical protein SAMN03159382_03927 [Pseudomonas sp. NFACC23-1]SFW85835.1 hypothetical protein SAMN05660640_04443 [Pseudomonas sp. NFACC16-2]